MTQFKTKSEALKAVAQVAMGDLYGVSEAPDGMPDNYPFNACSWQKSLPLEWQREAEAVVVFVYHNEMIPEGL